MTVMFRLPPLEAAYVAQEARRRAISQDEYVRNLVIDTIARQRLRLEKKTR